VTSLGCCILSTYYRSPNFYLVPAVMLAAVALLVAACCVLRSRDERRRALGGAMLVFGGFLPFMASLLDAAWNLHVASKGIPDSGGFITGATAGQLDELMVATAVGLVALLVLLVAALLASTGIASRLHDGGVRWLVAALILAALAHAVLHHTANVLMAKVAAREDPGTIAASATVQAGPWIVAALAIVLGVLAAARLSVFRGGSTAGVFRARLRWALLLSAVVTIALLARTVHAMTVLSKAAETGRLTGVLW
jgi:hypothetical protein